jgi:hypothetical protein|tara:strand:- start:163 stop:423 length:261 start_codon:yes stop_codon:yes gene_type:complete
MFQEAGTWFWSHVVVALLLIWTDSNDTLEPAVNNFEKMLGIYQEPIDTTYDAPSLYYDELIDSTWVLPDRLQITKDTTSADIPPIR